MKVKKFEFTIGDRKLDEHLRWRAQRLFWPYSIAVVVASIVFVIVTTWSIPHGQTFIFPMCVIIAAFISGRASGLRSAADDAQSLVYSIDQINKLEEEDS